VQAFSNGLSVFVSDDLKSELRQCCTATDLQQMVCGSTEIDVDDWAACAEYQGREAGGRQFDADSPLARWFWAAVRAMSQADRTALLSFATGSTRVPAQWFRAMMGFNGAPARFRLEVRPRCFAPLATNSTIQLRFNLRRNLSPCRVCWMVRIFGGSQRPRRASTP
jgi:hypothetical protein